MPPHLVMVVMNIFCSNFKPPPISISKNWLYALILSEFFPMWPPRKKGNLLVILLYSFSTEKVKGAYCSHKNNMWFNLTSIYLISQDVAERLNNSPPNTQHIHIWTFPLLGTEIFSIRELIPLIKGPYLGPWWATLGPNPPPPPPLPSNLKLFTILKITLDHVWKA